jgi:protein tyrosine phosphatase (PTP) superfamily phosphohydrolase (DUF442 family)
VLILAGALALVGCDSEDGDGDGAGGEVGSQAACCSAADPDAEPARGAPSEGDATSGAAPADGGPIDPVAADAGSAEPIAPDAARSTPDAGPPGAPHDTPAAIVLAPGERDIGHGWIGFGQPDEARLRAVVEQGARVISLRYPEEDPFDEQALVESLGGTFVRYPTQGGQYQDEGFRQGMFDLYDAQLAEGGTVYLHCASSNRVGASWALYHFYRRGYSAEEAVAVGQQAGLSSLAGLVRQVIGE